MSALTDLQTAVAKNTEAITAAVAQRAADKQTIADLQAQVAALQTQVTDEPALVAMTTEITAADATLAG